MKKKVLIIIGVLVALVVGVLAYFIISDLNQEDKLRDELTELSNLANSEELDEDKINKLLDRTVTKGDYKVVEIAFKSYLSDAFDNVFEIMDILEDDKMVSLLTVSNYQEDGPLFEDSLKYISETRTRLQELSDSYYSFFTEKKAMSYIEDKGLDSYYIDLYRNEYVGDINSPSEDKTLENSINKIIELLNNSEEIINFLKNNKDYWHVEEESIVFDNNQLVDQYNSLIDKLA